MNIHCPECKATLDFEAAFESSFCWSGHVPSVAFNCPSCGNAVYFGPRDGFIEVGCLGAGPTLDPIPMDRYNVQVTYTRSNQTLTIPHAGQERSIPSAYEFIKYNPSA